MLSSSSSFCYLNRFAYDAITLYLSNLRNLEIFFHPSIQPSMYTINLFLNVKNFVTFNLFWNLIHKIIQMFHIFRNCIQNNLKLIWFAMMCGAYCNLFLEIVFLHAFQSFNRQNGRWKRQKTRRPDRKKNIRFSMRTKIPFLRMVRLRVKGFKTPFRGFKLSFAIKRQMSI